MSFYSEIPVLCRSQQCTKNMNNMGRINGEFSQITRLVVLVNIKHR